MAEEDLESFYDNELDEDVKDLLSKIEYAGSYYSKGTITCNEMPTIDVKKVCTLKYPVPEDQIKMVIEKCVQAPHGKGTETVVDTSVRKVWQLDPKAIKLTGMDKVLALILPKISLELGLGPQDKVKANLYKLLVYDKGAFFLPHKDTEKEEKMFGTLVISLPSIHKGGDLVIRHSGHEQTISMDIGSDNDKTINYCGFYADCEHEVKEVTEGNRICLVYNLLRTGRNIFPPTIDVGSIVRSTQALPQIESGLIKYFEKHQNPVFVLLEHQYPLSNFNSKKLKGRDIVITNLFNLISKNISCNISLGIIQITEEGYMGDDNAKDRDIPKTPLGDKFSDFDGVTYSIDCISTVDLNGNPKESRLGVSVILGELEGSKTTKKMVTETTGNEGSTYEKLYQRAAIILQPTKPYNPIKPTSSTTTTTTKEEEQTKVEQQQQQQQQPTTTTTTTTPNTTTTTTTTTTTNTVAENKVDEPIKVEQPVTSTETVPSTTATTENKVEETPKQENTTTAVENKVEEQMKVEQPVTSTETVPTTTTTTENNNTTTTESKVEEPMKVEQPAITTTTETPSTETTATTENKEQSENIDSDQPLKKQKLE